MRLIYTVGIKEKTTGVYYSKILICNYLRIATWYGEGVYFAQSSKYSEKFTYENDENLRKLYVADVLVGRSVETKEGDKYPPTPPGLDIPYDSGKAPDSRTEGIYVIFHDSQAYPTYLITFKM